jgi:hypothetical protein
LITDAASQLVRMNCGMSGYVPKRDAPVGDGRGSFPGKAGINHPLLIAISKYTP